MQPYKYAPDPIPVEFCFAPRQALMPSSISDYLDMNIKSEETSTPVYYHYKRALVDGCSYIALFYVLFYTDNPGYQLLPCCPFRLPVIGQHPVDVEHVIIFFEETSMIPKLVYFSAHGGGQGMWVPYDECDFSTDGALRIYVSPTSHAMYPKAKSYYRIFGFANDVTSDKGAIWKPSLENFEDAHTQSWSDVHYQIARGINNPKNVPNPRIGSITPWQRFALALPYVREQVANKLQIHAMPISTSVGNTNRQK